MRSDDKRDAGERLVAAIFASFVLHALFFLLTPKQKPPDPIGPVVHLPLNVVIAPQHAEPAPAVPSPPSVPATAPAPRPLPRIDRPPTPLAPRFPPTPIPRADAPRVPLTPPEPPAPPVDMMAAIEQRRAQRRAADASMARGAPTAKPDAAERNLATLSGHEGVGGVFQILEKGVRRATFAFNGFRAEGGQRQWREVIEVDAGIGGDVDLAIIRRMIDLIRTHYTGDFQWESHRLGRVVVLSARKDDQAGLEEFLTKEFFGAPPPIRR